ncbi:MAG: PAS domain S-box protein [Ignavibacteriales bacterium]|nr:PAS domain S-box protein [Ignavibacteriales bacterium]
MKSNNKKKASIKNSSAAKKKLKSVDVQLKDPKQIETEEQKKTAHLKIKSVPIQEGDKVSKTRRVKRDSTELKQAEVALKISENNYQNLYENAPVGIYRTKIDGSKILEINNTACTMLGFTKEEMLSQPSAIRWADIDRRNEIITILKKYGVANNFNADILTKDGSKISCLLSMNMNKTAGYLEGFIVDITERKRAEEVINDNEKRFRDLIESLPQLFWTCRVDGPCDYLSKQWVEYTGIPEKEQLGYGWLEQLHPDDKDRTVSEWMEKVKTGESFDIEFRIRRADGIYRWFKTRAVPMRDTNNIIIKWFGSNTEFDGLKRSLETQERLVSTIESSTDLISYADLNANILYMNLAGKKILGLNADDDITNSHYAKRKKGIKFLVTKIRGMR